jgi:hypothetical protein
MTEGWTIPKWTERYLWYKWLLFDRSMSKRTVLTSRQFRIYVRRVQQMHISLDMRFKQWDHLPKAPVRQRRPPSETPLASIATPDTVDPEANNN